MALLDRFRLDGKTAIVTGGSRGIGYAIAEGLADVGANVVVANRDAEDGRRAAADIAEATGADTLAVPTDVTDEAVVEALVAETVEEFGGLTVLVNNAGISATDPAEEMDAETFRRTLEVNTTGAFLCAKHAARRMKAGDGGSVINVSSMSAFMANYPQHQVSYQSSKAALEGMKNQLASEWAEYGIRVNNINPGYVETEMLPSGELRPPQWREETLLDRFADPEEIAPLAVYLASEAASYVTGTSVLIDGGYLVR
jgi:NAD(P)-dependent dehydrogenase (short-subunit alcohol dehydrogenase family)